MTVRGGDHPQLLQRLGLPSFQQRWPWIGGDLQTLRDTLREVDLPHEQGVPIEIPVPALPSGAADAGALLALLDQPQGESKGLVLLLHGLGGSSSREGLRRMGVALQVAGFAVLRLNLRGADPGRHLAGGTYAARCNSDLLPVIARARTLAAGRPLLGAGISLGGTMLLNACLALPGVLDGLFCASSPLDLAACSASIERPRNRIYQRWLLKRLVRQTLADPFGVSREEEVTLQATPPRSIRAFDSALTAPRWGFANVEAYYREASPLQHLVTACDAMPPTLLLQALDDPWVPASSAMHLSEALPLEAPIRLLFTRHGGHNGFHGRGGCWGDQLAAAWLSAITDR
ncbi:alpha/beta hydrolase [Synechococcus sp. KORDI-52]|uniref:alpha/beta fold hydrolase n=1 Tax=Synechococcus sp. KORDI-52 TaxID=585425 RepID=UPI0004E098CA|nr:alpha/beta fold hydrolase [Synechococcus sp. KORDI-52]AII48773.1 alpha/beta hydrolase [Synechococcus sp. KORDI-52]